MFIGHAAQLETLPDSDTLWDAALSVFAAAGLSQVIYLVSDAARSTVTVRTNLPEIYSLTDPAQDPFLDYCCKTYDTTWTGAARLPDYDYLPERAKRLIRAASDVGFVSGLGIPIGVDRVDRFGGFNLGSGLDGVAFETRFGPMIAEIQSFCFVLHRRFVELAASSCDRLAMLSSREREVLALIADGLTRKECAKVLNLSPNTIAEYTKSIYRKLGVRNRVEAARVMSG